MFNFSMLKNRPILSKDLLCIIGSLSDCVFEETLTKIAYFLCINNDGDFLIAPDNFFAINDALVVRDMTGVKHIEDVDFTTLKTLVGKPVYSDTGHHIGMVNDLTFSASGRVGQILIDNGTLKASDVAGVGEIVLLKTPSKKRSKTKPVNLTALAKENKPVGILDENNIKEDENLPSYDDALSIENGTISTALLSNMDDIRSDNEHIAVDNIDANDQPVLANPTEKSVGFVVEKAPITMAQPKVAVATTPQPPRIISDFNFLLGRTLATDLYTFSGELIAYKNTPVTVSVVDKARLNGKLLELTYNSH